MMENRFDVDFLQEAMDFLESIEEKARRKIIYNLHKARKYNDLELLKKLNDNIWEFRTLYSASKKTHNNQQPRLLLLKTCLKLFLLKL